MEQSTEEVVTKAKQKVIVGTKDFTGTYEYKKTCPLPFEVEVIEDPTLSKGETVVDQKGVAGSKTTSYKQDIRNGEAVGEATKIGEEVTVNPTKHIVRVGTKALTGTNEKVVDKAIPYETKVIYDENLEAGNRVVDNEGKDGKERVTTTITSIDGNIEVNSEGKVLTPKEDRVVRVGIKPVVKEEAIPQDSTYKHNPNLEAGTINKISEGTPGKVTITTTFNKETGKLESKVVRTEPTNAEYEYGSKTTGEVKVKSEIPYEVEIIEDPTMDAGTHKVTQEGVVGEKETTLVIENSVEKSRSDKTTKEAVKKIIRVGTKPTEKMCPVPEGPSTPNNPVNPNPSTPENPVNPNPSTPESPVNPNPSTPESPASPNPSTSSNPANPNPNTSTESESSAPSRRTDADDTVGRTKADQAATEVAKDDAKAPQTYDPGIAAPTGLAALASGLLVGLERLKRRKRD